MYFGNVEPTDGLPDKEDDGFDDDITKPAANEPSFQVLAFIEMREAYLALLEADFTENEALRFLALITVYSEEL